MNGLYQRALDFYRQDKGLRLVARPAKAEGMDDIPAEERESVLKEIDALLERNRLSHAAEKPRGGRSGLALPLLVNFFILAAVTAAVLLFTAASRGEETQLVSASRAVKGAENQLVETLRRESAAQLGQKDQAIVAFQRKLTEAAAERERLAAQADEAIHRRETEIAAEMAAALAAERAKLRDAGVGTEDAEARVALLEAGLKAESAKLFEEFQRQARDEAAKNAAAVDTLIAEYERNLGQAQSERSLLRTQYETREAELKSQYARAAETIQAEKAAVQADLERIREQRLQEDLVEGRIIASYDAIGAGIAAEDYPAALENLAKLRASLDAEPARSIESVKKRRSVELFMLGALEELIRNRVERNSVGTAALVQTKARIDASRDKAALADQAFARRDYVAARDLYLAALAEIPEAKLSHERLQSMALAEREALLQAAHNAALETERTARLAVEEEKAREAQLAAERLAGREAELETATVALETERSGRLAAEARARTAAERSAELEAALARESAALARESAARAEAELAAEQATARAAALAARREELLGYGFRSLDGAKAAVAEGAWDAALERYRQALGLLLEDEAAAAAIIDQAALAGYRTGAAADAAERAGLAEALARMRQELAAAPAPAQDADPALGIAALIRAKLLLWQILQTEPIKSQYPDLYATMQAYFDTFAREQRQTGREASLGDLLAIAEALDANQAATYLADAPESEREILSRLLERLENLTRP